MHHFIIFPNYSTQHATQLPAGCRVQKSLRSGSSSRAALAAAAPASRPVSIQRRLPCVSLSVSAAELLPLGAARLGGGGGGQGGPPDH